jgi:predicted nucleic acid-binding protein
MSYLLDTCVLSETTKKTPNPLVVQWINQQPPQQLFLSTVTLAEIKKGLFKIKTTQPERYLALLHWLQNIEIKFAFRILELNQSVLQDWAEITAYAELKGKKMAVMDSLIAATAYHYHLVVVTDNVDDFKIAPVEIINPYHLKL